MKRPESRHSAAQASERVVDAVASAEGVDPMALPPLYEAIDPDDLDSAVRSSKADGLRIRFEYSGYEVAVSGDNSIELTEQDD